MMKVLIYAIFHCWQNDAGGTSPFTIEKELIEDDIIVEFSYEENDVDKFMSWKPLRIRHDKTSEYRNADLNMVMDIK